MYVSTLVPIQRDYLERVLAAPCCANKWGQEVIKQLLQITVLIYSVDGMACKEARAWEKRVASLLASKMDRPYSEMCGFVRSRMSLAIVCSNTLLLRGQRAHRALRPVLEDGASFTALGRARGW